ncbi:MAG: hypothetical protein MUO61_03430 [Dehalococcoidia bacterium]|nr:hypothetical protein [Dehalococcoidia bacterium]
METLKIPEDVQTLVTQAEGDIVLAQRFIIASNDDYVKAGEILKTVKGRYQEIEAKRKEMTLPLDEAKRKIMDFFRQPLEHLSNAERQIKSAILVFGQEQERIRREQEQQLQVLARAEQERLDKLAMEGITQAQEEGNLGKVEEILATVVQIAIPVVQSEKPKVQGIKTVTHWRYKVIDETLIPREYLIPNEKLLANIAITTKGTIKIPGVEFYTESTVASSAR